MTLMACYGPGCVSEKCGDYEPDTDAGRTLADAQVVFLDAAHDGAADAQGDASDAGPSSDAGDAGDAALDAPVDAPADAPDGG